MAIQDATEAERRRARQVRAARNQSLFREVNERIETLQMGWGEPIHIEFVCECYDDACSLPLTMKRVEYAAVRQDSLSFVVLPEHVDAQVEEVVDRHEDYWVVRKIEAGMAMAQHTDPRRRAFVNRRG